MPCTELLVRHLMHIPKEGLSRYSYGVAEQHTVTYLGKERITNFV